MSHVTSVSLEVKDLECLKATCKALGLEFMEGQKTWKWVGCWYNDYSSDDAAYRQGLDTSDYGKGEHAIRMPGCSFEIGVVTHPKKPGSFLLAYDFYGDGHKIMTKFGKGLDGIKQEYAAQVAVKKLNELNKPGQRRWMIQRNKLPTGQIQIKAVR